MESWSFISEGKGFVSDETISHTDSLSRSRNALMGWELKTPCAFASNILVSGDQQAIESQGFGELGLPEMMGKHFQNGPNRNVLSSKVYGEKSSNTNMVATPNLFVGEYESSSKISSSIVDSNSKGSSLIDLKLGRLPDTIDFYSSKSSRGTPILSSSEPSTAPKRIRVSRMYSQTAYCQVHGCNKDLSSCKDYHKRHKVCEAHSKTAKVIVNGIEQRFCQQCSRFHLLVEFDDGKRSCRKRLAGHNVRRRKPLPYHSGRDGRLLELHNGGNMLTTASFICQEILPTGILNPGAYGTSDWYRNIKFEGGIDTRPLSGMPVANGNLHLKPVLPSYDIRKQYPHQFLENGTNPLSGSLFSENSSQSAHDLRGLNTSSHSISHETRFGSDGFRFFNTASTAQGTDCAHSLLSSQSDNSSSHWSRIPTAQVSQASEKEKLMEGCLPVSISRVSDRFPSSGMNSGAGSYLRPTDDFGISDRIFGGLEVVTSKNSLSCEKGTTIDLLQLSSQLQRVGNQRQSKQVKQGIDAFCCLRIT